jgi:hypothetical protein
MRRDRTIDRFSVNDESDGSVRFANGVNVLIGLWLIAAPFVLDYAAIDDARWNDIIVGASIAALSLMVAMTTARREDRRRQPWPNYLTALLGAWLIAAPHMLDYAAVDEALWNDTITGAGVVIMSLWSAMAIHRANNRQRELEEHVERPEERRAA